MEQSLTQEDFWIFCILYASCEILKSKDCKKERSDLSLSMLKEVRQTSLNKRSIWFLSKVK